MGFVHLLPALAVQQHTDPVALNERRDCRVSTPWGNLILRKQQYLSTDSLLYKRVSFGGLLQWHF